MSQFGHRPVCAVIDCLETRFLMSSSIPSNIDITKAVGNQAGGVIEINPQHPSELFTAVDDDAGAGLRVSLSSDGGNTWTSHRISDGTDNLPPAFGQVSAAYDPQGTLFLTYLNDAQNQIEIVDSTDSGQTFSVVGQFGGSVSNPKIASGPGSVWVAFQYANAIVASWASDTSQGIGPFQPIRRTVPGSQGATFSDLAVDTSGGSATTPGLAAVVFQRPISSTKAGIYVSISNLGTISPSFRSPSLVTTVQPQSDLPAQPNVPMNASPELAFANPNGAFAGRLYLVDAESPPPIQPLPAKSGATGTNLLAQNTDIVLRYLDPDSIHWSGPVLVNDDAGVNSHFLPQLAVNDAAGASDPAQDAIMVGWYDARNDLGTGGPTDTDNVPNDDVQYFMATLVPATAGMEVGSNVQISQGSSNEADAFNAAGFGGPSSLAFHADTVAPLWADNSNSTGDNPNGSERGFNAYTIAPFTVAAAGGTSSSVTLPTIPAAGTSTVVVDPTLPTGLLPRLRFSNGQTTASAESQSDLEFTLTYASATAAAKPPKQVNPVFVTAPDGTPITPAFVRKRGSTVLVFKMPSLFDYGLYKVGVQATAGSNSSDDILGYLTFDPA